MKRTIIKIDEALCNGCGACVTGCHEGALRLIDGKAVMVSELYCDGLGACIGECPVGAIELEEREAEPYSEEAVMERIATKGEAVIIAHLKHLKEHGERGLLNDGLDWLGKRNIKIDMSKLIEEHPLACGCPGSMARDLRQPDLRQPDLLRPAQPVAQNGLRAAASWPLQPSPVRPEQPAAQLPQPSQLRQFPVQLHLVNPAAPFFQGADLLLAADCTAFAAGSFHNDYLKGRMLAIACPKLDDNTQSYVDKLTDMIDLARINTLAVLIMEVPCCGGLVRMAQMALDKAQRKVPVKVVVLSVRGEVVSDQWI